MIDGRRWLRDRARYLEGLLAGDPPADVREAAAEELERVRAELGRADHRWWWIFGARLPR